MKLNREILNKKEFLEDNNIKVPSYDITRLKESTANSPIWLHLGAGNIFRAFLASCHQKCINMGLSDKGIIIAEGYDYEIVDILKKYDNLTINATLKSSGDVDTEIIGSITDYLKMDVNSSDYNKVREIFCAESLQLISLTITEKGYSLVDSKGVLVEAVQLDLSRGPEKATSYIGRIVSLLYQRFQKGAHPIALVSMDNMSNNGQKLEEAVVKYAREWEKNKFVPVEFLHYLGDSNKVSFPWSMIDKITPRPDENVEKILESKGFTGIAPQETSKHTFLAPFVNGEETQYLVIEDKFPNGRPGLENVGILFTDKETVNKIETMKVTTCLNPLHTALAIFGCLLDYRLIYEEMKNPELNKMVKVLGYKEGLAVVEDPRIIDPKFFLDEVINVRLTNPFMPDTPQRIATDTSQKLSVRFGETVKSYIENKHLKLSDLQIIPLVYAGWLRYLVGVNDLGEQFQISPDPLLPELTPVFSDFKIGGDNDYTRVEELLKDENIFGLNIYETVLHDKVMKLFKEMLVENGAVERTLINALNKIEWEIV